MNNTEATRLFNAGWYAAADLGSRDDLYADIGSPFHEKRLAEALAAPAEGDGAVDDAWKLVHVLTSVMRIRPLTASEQDELHSAHVTIRNTRPAATAAVPEDRYECRCDQCGAPLSLPPSCATAPAAPKGDGVVVTDEMVELAYARWMEIVRRPDSNANRSAIRAALTAAIGSAGGVEGAIEDSREAGSAYASASALAQPRAERQEGQP